MKVIFLCLSLLFTPLAGMANAENDAAVLRYQSEKQEIHPSKLPTSTQKYIMTNYPGSSIVKAFRLGSASSVQGFQVVVKTSKGEVKLNFDKQGNFKNKG